MRLHPLIRLYPKRWRDRYAIEFRALLDDTPAKARQALDIIRGAAAAHRNPFPPGDPAMTPRSRLAAAGSALALAAVIPALAFLAAALAAALQPAEYEPSRTARALLDWFGALPTPVLAVALLAGPALALVLGVAIVGRRLLADDAFRSDLVVFGGAAGRLLRRPTVVVAALAAAAAVVVLLFAAGHLVAG